MCRLLPMLRNFGSRFFDFVFLNLVVFLFDGSGEFLFFVVVDDEVSSPLLEGVSGQVIIQPFKNSILNFRFGFNMAALCMLPRREPRVKTVVLPTSDKLFHAFLR